MGAQRQTGSGRPDPGGLRSERGISMLEVLLATTILLFGALALLGAYDAGWRSFKKGENATEQQQSVRIAFDKLTLDVQMAGFNYNPDGDTGRPDEQIEAAYDTAIVVRGDFDGPDPVASVAPEDVLAGGAFDVVSIGNDEIVVYALAKPDGSSTGTLTFDADVADSPRDGAVETVSVPNVAMVQDDPPYTLYRITLNNDVGAWGGPGFFERTPVAENVHSLTFRYIDVAGAQINSTFNLGGIADDIGGADELDGLNERSAIDRIEVLLEGLTRDPDMNYADPADTDPDTRAHRKFELASDITPRNKGMIGVRDLPAN